MRKSARTRFTGSGVDRLRSEASQSSEGRLFSYTTSGGLGRRNGSKDADCGVVEF
jgi:hypothetical protein